MTAQVRREPGEGARRVLAAAAHLAQARRSRRLVSTSTIVRTKRPQCAPLLCSSGASSGTVTGVARIAAIVVADIGGGGKGSAEGAAR